jgi:hypothetical protein
VPAHALAVSPLPALRKPVPVPKKKEAEVEPPLSSDNELDSMGWD